MHTAHRPHYVYGIMHTCIENSTPLRTKLAIARIHYYLSNVVHAVTVDTQNEEIYSTEKLICYVFALAQTKIQIHAIYPIWFRFGVCTFAFCIRYRNIAFNFIFKMCGCIRIFIYYIMCVCMWAAAAAAALVICSCSLISFLLSSFFFFFSFLEHLR